MVGCILSKRIIRGYWDCPYCGTTGIDGLVDICPKCSSGKRKDTKYYMKGSSPSTVAQSDVLTESELNRAGIKVEECDGEHKEWLCLYCGYLNNYGDNKCQNCHADRSEAEEEYLGEDLEQKYAPTLGEDNYIPQELVDETPATPIPKIETKEEALERKQKYIEEVERKLNKRQDDVNTTADDIKSIFEDTSASSKKPSLLKRIFNPRTLATTAVVLLVVSFLTFMLWPLQKTVELTDQWWECAVNVEEERIVEESGWSLPADATLIRTSEEISGYRQVLDHYETKTVQKSREVFSHYDEQVSYQDNGNGTFTEHVNRIPVYKTEYYTETVEEPVYRDEPIYQTKYYYTIPKWFLKDTYKTSEHDKKPYFSTDYTLKEKERDTWKTTDFYLKFNDDSKQHVNEEEYMKAEIGQVFNVTYNRFGGVYKNELVTESVKSK